MLLHRKLANLSAEMVMIADDGITHDQIGVGTGEDMIPFCYMWERSISGCSTLEEIKSHNASRVIQEDPEAPGFVGYFNGWDYDPSAVAGCKEILGFTSSRCVIAEKNLFNLTEYCQSATAATTAATGPTFTIHVLLYVLGRPQERPKTKILILDNPSNRKNLFEVIELTATLMQVPNTNRVMKAARISKADTKVNAEDAFHGPFMNSATASLDVSAEDDIDGELTERDLSYIVVDDYIDWVYRYLPPPNADEIEEMARDDHEVAKREHCVVSG
jgi:hypothetical protein